MPIEPWIEEGLLEAIEASGKARDDISLRDICNCAPGVFGNMGDNRRRAVQLHFKNLKSRSIRSWADYLDQNIIARSEATIRLLWEQDQQSAPPSVASEADKSSDSSKSPPASPEANPSSDISTPLNLSLENLSVQLPPQSVIKLPPIRRHIAFSTPPTYRKMATPEGTTPSWAGDPSTASITSDPTFLGSNFNPYIIPS
jgi:hypothetical protein